MSRFARSLTIVVGDPFSLRRSCIVRSLEEVEAFRVIGEASETAEALEMVHYLEPTVAVLGLELFDSDEAAAQAISGARPSTAIVALASDTQDDAVLRVLTAGASGLIDSEATTDELREIVLAAARGDTRLPNRLQQRLMASIREGGETAASLTSRELDILRLLADGLSSAEIGKSLFVAESTVKTHLHHIYEKLGARNAAAAVAEGARRRLLDLRPEESTRT